VPSPHALIVTVILAADLLGSGLFLTLARRARREREAAAEHERAQAEPPGLRLAA
jgi:hypothetical protein